MMTTFVSVVIPCFNEEEHIAGCIDSILANSYPKELCEIFVVDGMSSDRTREIVKEYEARHSFIRLLDNPKKLTPAALNIGIKQCRGEVIVRIDAHTTYPDDYISKCVAALNEYEADNVGGIIVTVAGRETTIAKAIAIALAHPFGVGESKFRLGRKGQRSREVDTVPFGCFRRSLFNLIGLFNENLPVWRGRCNEDLDFNKRIREAGGKVILCLDIKSYYHARPTLWKFFVHNFNNGFLVVAPLGRDSIYYAIRHFVPILSFLLFMSLCALSVHFLIARVGLVGIIFLYLALSSYFSFKRALNHKKAAYFFIMPLVFGLLHASYALGSVSGTVLALWNRKIIHSQPS